MDPAAVAQDLLLAAVVLKILKAQPRVLVDGLGDLVDVDVDALVHGLDALADVDIALKELRLVDADQGLELPDQSLCLALRDEVGGLHHVHQELDLLQLEVPAGQGIAPVVGEDVHAVAAPAQSVEIVVEALSLGPDAEARQMLDHLADGDAVPVVGVLEQIVPEQQQLQLLSAGSRHGLTPLSRDYYTTASPDCTVPFSGQGRAAAAFSRGLAFDGAI